ncbi:MAG TPA: helix-turn-helix domain-containing protein [Caulobacteraceae bacterium]|nr:helix-turn-helix domain-containing protein [Caulobacteraceae bacterium]
MARSYTLKRRAEQQADTRQRIIEAAVDLHGTIGPARTSLSMVAERAKVQRNTLYAHFPDELSLAMACSGLAFERDPPPAAAQWRAIGDRSERLRQALTEIYGWYAKGAQLLGCVLRDAEHHASTREVSELRFGPVVADWHKVLGEGLSPAQQSLIHLSLSFYTWRALVEEAGMAPEAAVATMARAIESVA